MKTFKTYIAESTRMTTHGEIEKAIAAYKKAGEILNPAYKDLVDQAKRIMRQSSPDFLSLVPNWREDRNQDLMDLYYTSFDSFASHKKIEKLIAKVEKVNNPNYKKAVAATKQYLKDWKGIGEDLAHLKGKAVKVSQKRAEAKTAAAGAMARKFADSSSLIKIFESHLEEYKKRAEDEAKAFVKKLLDNLKKNGWDLDKIAPYPRSMNSDYKIMKNKRDLYQMVTKASKSTYSRGEPHIVQADQAKINHYVEMNVKGAEEAYRSFMEKMIQKIGKPVIDAKMTGNIWTNALLTVTTDDGDQQVWKTQMILNFSKYNKMFNQFPSRRVK
jgi:hypothetical protein